MKRLVVLVGACLALAACGGNTLDHGRVTGKEDRPAYTNVMVIPVITGCTKYGCTFMFIPYVMYHPEQWVLDLRACSNGKCKTGHAYLDEGTWSAVKVGSYWQEHPGDSKPNPAIRLRHA